MFIIKEEPDIVKSYEWSDNGSIVNPVECNHIAKVVSGPGLYWGLTILTLVYAALSYP